MGSGNGLEPPYGMVLRPLLRTLRGGGGESGSRAWKLFPRLWRMSSFVALGGEEGITNQYTTSGRHLGNSFVHLVNNSICKKSHNFGRVETTENGFEVHEHMWSNEVFTAYVDDIAGKGCWRERMQPRMEQIITWSLLCAQDMVEHRKKSWELYGYDFMVDDQYKPWLIEINSSPACDYSTKVTEQYVQRALTDLLKVTIDLPAWEASRKKSALAGAAGEGTASVGKGDKTDALQTSPASSSTPTECVASPESAPSVGGERYHGSKVGAEGCSENDGVPEGSRAGTARRSDRGGATMSTDDPPDTGLWRLLYKGPFVPFPVASFGTDLSVKGTHISKPARGGTGVAP